MGECYCSNIAIMQLFHELKQQFPALPDHIVSQCIAQNSHDKETCARSLRATQESRPSPGAFPPPSPGHVEQISRHPKQSSQRRGIINYHHRATSLNGVDDTTTKNPNGYYSHNRAHRPSSLDIGTTLGGRQCSRSPNGPSQQPSSALNDTLQLSSPGPLSAPPGFYPTIGFFDDPTVPNVVNANVNSAVEPITTLSKPNTTANNIPNSSITHESRNRGNHLTSTAFEVNVNVACSPVLSRDFRTVPTIGGTAKRSDLVVEPRPHYVEPRLAQLGNCSSLVNGQRQQQHENHTRSYTSVSLTLRPPSSEPQAPIDIRSQGSSLTYSTSSSDPRGFQSRLQISIGPGNVGSVASARIRPTMAQTRPTSIIPHVQTGPQRPPGLPAGPPSQLPRPTTTMSAPTTPSVPTMTLVEPVSLPTTPSTAPSIPSPSGNSLTGDPNKSSFDLNRLSLNQVTESQKRLIAEQLMKKDKLDKEVRLERGRLDAMKQELQAFLKPLDSNVPPEDLKRNLKSEIYQLQLECDRLTEEVDKRSDPRVPLGETNEEFYQSIYTGQPFAFDGNTVAGVAETNSPERPILPSRPPAWQAPTSRADPHENQTEHRRDRRNDDDDDDHREWDERDGPSWVCRMCTFDNHPLMDKCEQCDMPRLLVRDTGETQDIHIRVTHHHNFSPRRTVHSWVV